MSVENFGECGRTAANSKHSHTSASVQAPSTVPNAFMIPPPCPPWHSKAQESAVLVCASGDTLAVPGPFPRFRKE